MRVWDYRYRYNSPTPGFCCCFLKQMVLLVESKLNWNWNWNSPTPGCIVEAAEALRYRRRVEHAEASVSVRPLGACAKSCQIGLATRSFPTAHIPNLLARAERYTGPNRVAHGAKSLDGLDSGTIISPECLRSLRSYRYDCSIRRNSNIFSNMVML